MPSTLFIMTTTYLFNKTNRTNTMSMQRQAILIIQSFFAKFKALVGKPVFTVSPNKVTVQVFYYSSTEMISNANINALGNALTQCWGRTVELRLIRLNHAALDSSIFAQYLSVNSNKYSFNRIFDMLKGSLPTVVSEGSVDELSVVPTSHITGVKIKLSGRLTTQRSSPRKTVQASRLGSSAKGLHGFVDFSQYTAKNKLGAFTMKVWISQQSR
jgi:ribosomal protein S3